MNLDHVARDCAKSARKFAVIGTFSDFPLRRVFRDTKSEIEKNLRGYKAVEEKRIENEREKIKGRNFLDYCVEDFGAELNFFGFGDAGGERDFSCARHLIPRGAGRERRT